MRPAATAVRRRTWDNQFLRAGELAQFVARDAFDSVCVEAEELQRYVED
jgi:hypothetical protein